MIGRMTTACVLCEEEVGALAGARASGSQLCDACAGHALARDPIGKRLLLGGLTSGTSRA